MVGGGAEAAEDLHRPFDVGCGAGDQLHELVVGEVVGARRGQHQAARGDPGQGEGVETLVAGDPLLDLGAALDEGRRIEIDPRPLARLLAQEVEGIRALEAAGGGESVALGAFPGQGDV